MKTPLTLRLMIAVLLAGFASATWLIVVRNHDLGALPKLRMLPLLDIYMLTHKAPRS